MRSSLPGATLKQEWPLYHYRIYTLATPLQPGESRELAFRTTLEERGFSNGAPLTRVVENGSFIDNSEIAPGFGPQRDAFLKDRAKRRKHGLPPDLRPPKLEDDSARAFSAFRHDSDFVRRRHHGDHRCRPDADRAGTDGERPGRRRPPHGALRSPTRRSTISISIQSARYAVERDVWHGPQGDVALAVYFHPGASTYNVERMLEAMKLSLQLFSEQLSARSSSRQARILEFPAYANFAQSVRQHDSRTRGDRLHRAPQRRPARSTW